VLAIFAQILPNSAQFTSQFLAQFFRFFPCNFLGNSKKKMGHKLLNKLQKETT